MQSITLELTLDDVNTILEALGEQPYVKVNQLIGSIHQQANAQLSPSAENASDDQSLEAEKQQ